LDRINYLHYRYLQLHTIAIELLQEIDTENIIELFANKKSFVSMKLHLRMTPHNYNFFFWSDFIFTLNYEGYRIMQNGIKNGIKKMLFLWYL
jgi:hypothetical protein